MKKIVFVLLLIVILGAVLRFHRLGEIPQGFHRDEAFLGYNAYSILKTGKDMNGTFLPLHLESFIYSPAGYSYFATSSIKLFDLNPFSIRFPSALFGTLTILALYFVARGLFSPIIALFSAAILAISPWHINLSRTATENTVVAFFILLGILFFLLWLKSKKLLLIGAVFLSFSLTLLIYQAPRVFLPLFIPLMFLILLKDRFHLRKNLVIVILFLVTIVLPLLFILSSPQLSLRIRTVSVFSTQETQLVIDEYLREDGVSAINTNFARLFHNKLVGYSLQFIHNYFKHFSFDFLFADQGLPIRYKIPGNGLLYLFELPLVLTGLFMLLRKKSREGFFLLVWVLLAPMGSSLTFDDVPNLQRTLIAFPALSIISASGLNEVLILIRKNKRIFKLGIGFIVAILFYSILHYLHQYYVHQLVHRPWFRHEGYVELVKTVNKLLPAYKKAIITNRESAPTIFFLFFGKYNPSLFQEETRNSILRDFDRVNFGKYEFSEEECPLIEFEDVSKQTGETRIVSDGEKDVLYINYGTCKIPETTARLLEEIRRKDGSLVFRVLELTGKK